ncbi:MAG: hypothetical protein F6K55_29550 [Moorea sp. SIO4A3]|nr:hypothetical protein [Moorena sp. SIO4A3]
MDKLIQYRRLIQETLEKHSLIKLANEDIKGEHPNFANPFLKLTRILGFQSIIESVMPKNGMLPIKVYKFFDPEQYHCLDAVAHGLGSVCGTCVRTAVCPVETPKTVMVRFP